MTDKSKNYRITSIFWDEGIVLYFTMDETWFYQNTMESIRRSAKYRSNKRTKLRHLYFWDEHEITAFGCFKEERADSGASIERNRLPLMQKKMCATS